MVQHRVNGRAVAERVSLLIESDALGAGSGTTVALAATLPDLLRETAARFGESTIQFPTTIGSGATFNYAELFERATRFASGLRRVGVQPNQIVSLLCPTAPEFVIAFFGITAVGAAVSPLSRPLSVREIATHQDRLLSLLACSRSSWLLAHPSLEKTLEAILGSENSTRLLRWADIEAAGSAAASDDIRVSPDDLALVQYTSGSTTAPRGVALRHRNVVAGLRAIIEGSALGPHDTVAIWLPLHHDMGLIGLIAAIVSGSNCVLWPPFSFIRDPARWLVEFARRRATVYVGPHFSYAWLLEKVTAEQLAAMDLSAWRVAFNGAEPIDAITLRAFIEHFGAAGFRPETMFPVFGLAEVTLAATFPRLGDPPLIEWVDRQALMERRRAVPVSPSTPSARGVVGVGSPVRGLELRITGDGGDTLGERLVGNIELRGASMMDAYLGMTAAESNITADGWLRTGDLGYCSGGQLFGCGRAKEMIIVHGTNYYPQDVERVLAGAPGVLHDRCVAVGIAGEGRERIAVVVESRLADAAVRSFANGLRARVSAALGLVELEVIVVMPNTIEYTTSGKARRLALRDRLLAGELAPFIKASSARAAAAAPALAAPKEM